tara:strand:- start:155 stop:652 length:498 start_codon:yes stop_codon:yes gene_type:complete
VVLGVLHVLKVIDVMEMVNRLLTCVGLGNDGFATLDGSGSTEFHPVAAEEGSQEGQLAVKGGRTPSTCYPQQTLKAGDLLPEDESRAIQEFNAAKPVADGIMAGNLLDAGNHIGVNTVGQSLRNANRQLRSEPPNPQVNVSPWQNTTIGPDLIRRPLEVSDSCGA